MGLRGCRYLARGKWDNLKYLALSTNRFDVGDNQVESKGCRELAKAVWSKMESVYLCMYSEMQMAITSTGRASCF